MDHLLSSIFLLLLLSTTATAQPPSSSGTAPAPATGSTDVIKILQKAGQFTTFIKLLKSTQVSDQINSQGGGTITVFAPTDNAFSAIPAGTLNSLTADQQLRLVQFHVLPAFYAALSQFQTVTNPLHTQAGNSDDGKYPLNVTASTDSQVNVTTGVVNATLTNAVYSDNDGKLAVFTVDKVLLPMDIFGTVSPAPAVAPAPLKSKDVGDGGGDDDKGSISGRSEESSAASALLGFVGGGNVYKLSSIVFGVGVTLTLF